MRPGTGGATWSRLLDRENVYPVLMAILALVPNVVDVLLSLLYIVVGFALGISAQIVRDWRSSRNAKIGLAAALACEVEAARAMTENSLKANESNVETTRMELAKGGPATPYVEIVDVDYQRNVFDANIGGLRVLGEGLMLTLTEFYRWLKYTGHMKGLNREAAAEALLTARRLPPYGTPSPLDLSMLKSAALMSVAHAAQYVLNQKRVLELAGPLVLELQRIGKVSVVGKVSVSTGAVSTFSTRQ